jgi:hypothetical protein
MANSLKKQRVRHINNDNVRRPQMNWQNGGPALLSSLLTTKHENKYDDKMDCMRYGEEQKYSSKRRQHADTDWVSLCSDKNPACSHNLCAYSDK